MRDVDPGDTAGRHATADDLLVPGLSTWRAMTSIDVRCTPVDDGWSCEVDVREGGDATRHIVSVDRADLERLAPGVASPDDLVQRSFEFLLTREPMESILREFKLPVIGRYFPEYEAEISRR
jgi:hypothetical protein